MKHFSVKIWKVLLILCLLVTLFTISAAAVDCTLVQGVTYTQEYIWGPTAGEGSLVFSPFIHDSSIVPGVTIGSDMYGIYVSGVPSTNGYFSTLADYTADNSGGSLQLSFTVTTSGVGTSYTGSFTATQNVAVAETNVVNMNEYVYSATLVSGRLPSGLNYHQYDTYFTLYGTPTESGYFSAAFSCATSSGTCNVTLNVNVVAAPTVLTILKSPSGETVDVGGSAAFISAAEAYSDVEWRVVSADGTVCYRNKSEIEARFPNVQVSVYQDETGREWLSLKNIPISMNGFYIQTKFWSLDKTATAFTGERSCLLSVKETVLQNPVITTQPASLSQTIGTAATLSVYATDPNNGTLKYQWYKNTTNSNVGGQQIMGATNATYTPPQTEGTIYYYATVTSTKDTVSSTPVTTQTAAVSYVSAAPTPTPAVASPAPAETPVVSANPQLPTTSTNKTGSLLQIFLLLAIMLLCIAAAVLVFLMRRDAQNDTLNEPEEDEEAYDDEEEEEYDDNEEVWIPGNNRTSPRKRLAEAAANFKETLPHKAPTSDNAPYSHVVKPSGSIDFWICPCCGSENTSRFCSECGAARPQVEKKESIPLKIYFCESCGWTPPDPAHPPKFCPECGSAMGSKRKHD